MTCFSIGSSEVVRRRRPKAPALLASFLDDQSTPTSRLCRTPPLPGTSYATMPLCFEK